MSVTPDTGAVKEPGIGNCLEFEIGPSAGRRQAAKRNQLSSEEVLSYAVENASDAENGRFVHWPPG